jgi:hypothetical protein
MSSSLFWRVPVVGVALLVTPIIATSTASADHSRRPTTIRSEIAAASARNQWPGHAGPHPVQLAGFTSQDWPVVVILDHRERAITRIRAGVDMTCTSGLQFSAEVGWDRAPIKRSGTVSVTQKVSDSPGSGVTLLTEATTLTGRLDRKHSTFNGMQLAYTFSDGTTDQCDSGVASFRATR